MVTVRGLVWEATHTLAPPNRATTGRASALLVRRAAESERRRLTRASFPAGKNGRTREPKNRRNSTAKRRKNSRLKC
jgi:hypothetical protein